MDQKRIADTLPPARRAAGLICPRCRSEREPAADDGPIARCPDDGLALVTHDAFAESDGDPFLGATLAERFVILGKLGAGSMGTVYRARQEGMGRLVAVKILRSDRALDAQSKARFAREAHALSLLTSPHTVTVFDFGEIPEELAHGTDLEGGSLYLAMELLEGEALGERLKRRPRLGAIEATKIAKHALLSLAEAHEKGVIHRDLKPDNLFLVKAMAGSQEEICKLLDFGIAKVVRDGPQVDALETQAGTVFGTPRYMSPEQAQGKELDARSDLYAVGVLLYQMLVGHAPFSDDDAVVVMARHIKTAPVPPIEAAPDAAIPRALSDLVLRALAKEPKNRPPSALAFIDEIDEALARAPGDAALPADAATAEIAALSRDDLGGHDARRAPSSGRPSRKLGLTAVAALAGATVASLLVLSAVRGQPGRPPLARSGLATLVRGARVAVGRAVSAPFAEAPGTSSAALPVAPAPTGAPNSAKPAPRPSAARKGYTRFE